MQILLLIEDPATTAVRDALAQRGHHVTSATGTEAIEPSAVDLIIADVELADRSNLFAHLGATAPGIEVVLLGPDRGSLPVEVIGRVDRPVDIDRLLAHVHEVAAILDVDKLREPVELVAHDTLFAGTSSHIVNLQRRVRLVARSEAPVWIVGDDGSGRAIVARAIHDRSGRRNQPFVAFNAAAFADEELSRLLFNGGGAAVERAAGGTVFLEQISATGPSTQRELMQFLDRKAKDAQSARLIVGVQPSDTTTAAQRSFSSELFYRLKVLEVDIPRLKDRAADLDQIVARMLERLANGKKAPAISADTMRLLQRYEFPGNLLELAHALTHAFVLAVGTTIEPPYLPPSIREPATAAAPVDESELASLDTVAKRFERDYLLRVLRSVGGNRGRAAEILGLSRKGLWGKLKAHGISDADLEEKVQP
jgi:two-component system, NtrC family, response regulator AtoC